jgi:hypothetical protein
LWPDGSATQAELCPNIFLNFDLNTTAALGEAIPTCYDGLAHIKTGKLSRAFTLPL